VYVFKVEFELDNDSGIHTYADMARVLRRVADRLMRAEHNGAILGTKKNKIGEFRTVLDTSRKRKGKVLEKEEKKGGEVPG